MRKKAASLGKRKETTDVVFNKKMISLVMSAVTTSVTSTATQMQF